MNKIPSYAYLPDDCRTGSELVDGDHDDLYKLVNMFRESKGDLGIFKSVFLSIVEYTVYHFDREERGFAACNYPAAAQHIAEHEALKTLALQILRDINEKPEDFDDAKIASVEKFLLHWLKNHIAMSDMAFTPYFADHAEAIAAMASVSFADSFGEDDGFSGLEGLLDCI